MMPKPTHRHLLAPMLLAASVHAVYGLDKNSCSLLSGEKSSAVGNVWFGGLVDDAADITMKTLDFLVEVSCRLQAPTHIFVSHGKDELVQAYADRLSFCPAEAGRCAELTVQQQAPDTEQIFPNSVDRLSFLRENQRSGMRSTLTGELKDNDFILLLDLDLQEVPSARDVEDAMSFMATSKAAADVICANGILSTKYPATTYDTYATVLLPDTWLHPLKARLAPEPYAEEDPKVVKGFQEEVTKGAMPLAAANAGVGTSNKSLVPVKSCFGGMAVYRAKTWFTKACEYKYDGTLPYDLFNYVDQEYKRVCEHTMFHDCLGKHNKDFAIAIHTGLVTKYHDAKYFINMNGDLKTRMLTGDPKGDENGMFKGEGQGRKRGHYGAENGSPGERVGQNEMGENEMFVPPGNP